MWTELAELKCDVIQLEASLELNSQLRRYDAAGQDVDCLVELTRDVIPDHVAYVAGCWSDLQVAEAHLANNFTSALDPEMRQVVFEMTGLLLECGEYHQLRLNAPAI